MTALASFYEKRKGQIKYYHLEMTRQLQSVSILKNPPEILSDKEMSILKNNGVRSSQKRFSW